jgi:hypothetical protein
VLLIIFVFDESDDENDKDDADCKRVLRIINERWGD